VVVFEPMYDSYAGMAQQVWTAAAAAAAAVDAAATAASMTVT
jgi:hypothetical protein